MVATLIELTLGESSSLEAIAEQSFNNDSKQDEIRDSFFNIMHDINSPKKEKVPSKYLHRNVHHYDSTEIHKQGDKIIVGEYCNHGVIVPRTAISIVFNQLYNCSPLISLISGDKEHIAFLHTWAIPGNSDVVDRQVKHWMKTISRFGEISETIFAPREGWGADTRYENALDYLKKFSQKTILLKRNIMVIEGIVNGEGVYFKRCGYHLWNNSTRLN